MKYVFNVLIAFVVIWIVWSVIDHEPKQARVEISSMDNAKDFDGARIVKTAKNKFRNPVSVEFFNDEMFVSNAGIADSPGFVCRTTLYGEFVDTLCIAGLQSPKGMVVYEGYLYIADVNRIAKYDIDNDTLVAVLPVEDAKNLNDIEKDRSGRLYVSDSQGKKIYCIQNDTARLLVVDTLLENVSGLSYYNGYIFAGAQKRIVRIEPSGRTRVFANVVYPVCGICSDDNGNFMTTDFAGNVYVVSSGRQQLLVRKRQGINSAGIGYIPEQNLLAMPTFAGNSVEIYEVGRYLQQNK